MNDITLSQADALHRLIGDASLALGLRARYLGALAYPVKDGAAPPVQSSVWSIVRPSSDRELGGIEPVGEEVFRISVARGGGAKASARWKVTIQGEVVNVSVFDVTDRGRALLELFKERLGAV